MKYIIIVPDGMADYPLEELGNKTPLQIAHTINMNYLAKHGYTGLMQSIPKGMKPGSEIGNLSLMGYNPQKFFTGRAPLEAANLNINLAEDEIAFRCNLVTVEDHKMVDYSAGHIQTKEAAILIDTLNEELATDRIRFYAGKSYRHLLVLKVRNVEHYRKIQCTAPHDILGKEITHHLPKGPESEMILKLMEHSKRILGNHQTNQVRIDLNENPANMIWLWGQGIRTELPSFSEKFGIQGSIISAVDLVNGIGKLAGLEVITVPGITGYYDTNFLGKAQYAIESLKNKDFVFIHIEAPDEASHNGDLEAKVAAIENIDRAIVGTILNAHDINGDVRILVLPDHPTPLRLRTHASDPVCFVMAGSGIQPNDSDDFSEATAKTKGLTFKNGEEMMASFITKNL